MAVAIGGSLSCSVSWPGCWLPRWVHFVQTHWAVHLTIYALSCIYLIFNKETFFFFLWLCWVFVSVQGLSLVAASGGHSSSRCAGLSLSWPLLLRSTGSRHAGSAIVADGPSCSVACGIFPDQGSNPCPLHWQADSQPLRHQGSPIKRLFKELCRVSGCIMVISHSRMSWIRKNNYPNVKWMGT